MMVIHNLIQGTQEWRTHRSSIWNASDAPTMLAMSDHETRDEWIARLISGEEKQFSDFQKDRILADGHKFEAWGRAYAEQRIGDDLYPITASNDSYGLSRPLGASYDGLTMVQRTGWEHKSMNDSIRAANVVEELPLKYLIQMEQQMMVCLTIERIMFMASKWDKDGNLLEVKEFWYMGNATIRARILAGWAQTQSDLDAKRNSEPVVVQPKGVAACIASFPALFVSVRGEVTGSNIKAVQAAANSFIENINTTLETDDDFATAEATVKFCSETEKLLDASKSNILGQTASIEEVMRAINDIQSGLRAKRLVLEKGVKDRKVEIKNSVVSKARKEYSDHIAGLEQTMKPIRITLATPNFEEATKNKRTVASLNASVGSVLTQAKIDATMFTADVRGKLEWIKSDHGGFGFLFTDLQQIITKPVDDFKLLVSSRIADYVRQQKEIEEEKAKIAKEEAERKLDEQKPIESSHSELPIKIVEPVKMANVAVAAAKEQFKDDRPSRAALIGCVSAHFGVADAVAVRWLSSEFSGE